MGIKKFLRGVLSVLLLGIAWQAAPNASAAPAEMTKAQQWSKAAFNSGDDYPLLLQLRRAACRSEPLETPAKRTQTGQPARPNHAYLDGPPNQFNCPLRRR